MRLTGKNTSLVGAEGESPPLPFIEVDADEAQGLIERGYATEVHESTASVVVDEVVVEPEAEQPEAPVEAAKVAEPSEPAAEQASVGVTVEDAPAAAGESQAAAGADSPVEATEDEKATARLREIADHIHLLTDDDMVKSGARAGKPKLDVLATSLGYPVTTDDVDAALALDGGHSE